MPYGPRRKFSASVILCLLAFALLLTVACGPDSARPGEESPPTAGPTSAPQTAATTPGPTAVPPILATTPGPTARPPESVSATQPLPPPSAPSATQPLPPPSATGEPEAAPEEAVNETAEPGDFPDDPRGLMFATLHGPLTPIARKMAESGNQAYIPVLMEFLRFRAGDEGIDSLASFISRIKDNVPIDQAMVLPPEQRDWNWWVEWLGQHPEVRPPEGFAAWKGQLFGFIDPAMGAFFYEDVKSEIRIEEIVWGGVRKDGIPDLTNPPVVPADEADYLNWDDRVFGVSINGEHRAYPLRILNPHEMANDVVGGVPFALAY